MPPKRALVVVYTYVRRAVLLKKHRTSKKAARASVHRRARASRARRRRTWNRYVLEEGKDASPPRGLPDVSVAVARAERRLEKWGEIFLLHASAFPRRRGGVRGDRAGDVPDALFPPHPRARAGGLRADAARRAAGRARAGARRAARGARRGHRDAGRRRARLFGVARARRDARLPRVQPLNVHLPERGGVPRCAQRARRAARGRHRQRGRRRGHERGWHGARRLAYALRRRPRGGYAAAARRLVDATRDALRLGLEACRPGARIGDVLEPIARRLGARRGTASSTGTPRTGVGRRSHQPPTEARRRREKRRGVAVVGRGSASRSSRWRPKTGRSAATLRDGWTVVTADRVSRSAQFEHTVGVGGARADLHARRRSMTTKTRVR